MCRTQLDECRKQSADTLVEGAYDLALEDASLSAAVLDRAKDSGSRRATGLGTASMMQKPLPGAFRVQTFRQAPEVDDYTLMGSGADLLGIVRCADDELDMPTVDARLGGYLLCALAREGGDAKGFSGKRSESG